MRPVFVLRTGTEFRVDIAILSLHENAEKIKAACAAMEQPVYQIGAVVAGEKKVVIDQTCQL